MAGNDEQEIRKRAEARVEAREGFRIHLLVFVLVNGFLWGIWAYTGADTSSAWPAFATAGWGIGLVVHGWDTYGRDETKRERAIQDEIRRIRDSRSG